MRRLDVCVGALADELLDRLPLGQPVDVEADLAATSPRVIGEMLDMTNERRDDMLRWAGARRATVPLIVRDKTVCPRDFIVTLYAAGTHEEIWQHADVFDLSQPVDRHLESDVGCTGTSLLRSPERTQCRPQWRCRAFQWVGVCGVRGHSCQRSWSLEQEAPA